jgi:hypothetical protein
MIQAKDMRNITNGYTEEWALSVGLSISDQIAIEQLRILKRINDGVTFLVIVTVIGIVAALINACGALVR